MDVNEKGVEAFTNCRQVERTRVQSSREQTSPKRVWRERRSMRKWPVDAVVEEADDGVIPGLSSSLHDNQDYPAEKWTRENTWDDRDLPLGRKIQDLPILAKTFVFAIGS